MDVVRSLVSKNKRRYKEDGFDLDLTYVYPNIIAMGFPSEKLEGVYRNSVDEVLRFLDTKHKDHYRVYNLCTERRYDGAKFHNRVVMYPFEDHHPPPLELIKPFCEELDVWLHADSRNIAAVHCKAGKGRTGVMICAYLLHRRKFSDAKTCLYYYGKTRTRDGKGVTIPSQRRYVEYYGELMTRNIVYQRKTLLLSKVKFITVPHLNNGTCNVYYDIFASKVKLGSSDTFEGQQSKTGSKLEMPLSKAVIVCGDVCIDFFHKPPRIGKKERIFQCWFNTFFVKDDELCVSEEGGLKKRYLTHTMAKQDLDKANKDKTNKIYKKEFKVVFYFEYPIDGTYINNTNCVNRSQTDDRLYTGTRPIARNGNSSNGSITGIADGTMDPPTGPMSRLWVADNEPHCSGDDFSNPKLAPPTSQSVPELSKVVKAGALDTAHRHLQVAPNRHPRVSPTGDRRAKLLPANANSDICVGQSDTASADESEADENFSDSDMEDEWNGCEVTAV